MRPFSDLLFEAIDRKRTPCIVGLDPDLNSMPESFLRSFNCSAKTVSALPNRLKAELCYSYNALVLQAVHDLVPAIKPQSAFYERFGSDGFLALERTLGLAKSLGLITILDVKRGDVGSTSLAYAEAFLMKGSPLESDCITVSPYLGTDSLSPFVTLCEHYGKGVFICAKTSNPGSGVLQDILHDGQPVYQHVASWFDIEKRRMCGQRGFSSIGLVVGGTFPEVAGSLRARFPHVPFLVPGLGAQGGSVETLRQYFNANGYGAIVNASRSVMYPQQREQDLFSNVRKACADFISSVRDVITNAR